MLISFYLQKLKDYVDQFNSSYSTLESLKEDQLDRDLIWSAIEQAADAVWRITQTIWPVPRRKAPKEQRELTASRGRELQRLFALTLGDRKKVNDFRNRLMHYDEDFDDWYLKSSKSEDVDSRRIVWRQINDAMSPVHSSSNCIVQEYDIGWGVLSAFGKQYSIRAFKTLINTIEERLPKVEKYIDNIAPERMRVSIV